MLGSSGVISPTIEEGKGQLKLLTHLKIKEIGNLQGANAMLICE